MIFEIAIILLLTWLLRIHFEQKRKAVNLPGPRGIPLLGNLLILEKKFHELNNKLTEKYGKAVYFTILQERFVLIGDLKLGRELYAMDHLTGRPVFDLFLLYEGEPLGVVNSEGNLWETHRRFTLRQLRDFGFGKNSMETMIMDEVDEFIDNLKKENEAPVGQMKERFSLAVVNSLWTVISGKRYQQNDPNLRLLAKRLNLALSAGAESGGIVFFFPLLRYIMPKYLGYTATREAFEGLKVFVKEAVEEHKQTFQDDYCRDFIDVYLKEMKAEANNPNSTFSGKDAEKQLITVVGDLFFAGTDTTSTTLSWAMLYLASNPEVQKKLYDEIYSITGGTRNISVADRPNCSYLQATIDEVLRKSSILPQLVSRKVLSDFTYKGVNYTKGTMVDINAYHIHRDPKTWGDPENFRPERFLTGKGQTYQKNENVIAFSVGKRVCLGEPLARDSTSFWETFYRILKLFLRATNQNQHWNLVLVLF